MKILVICQYYYPEPFRITDICEELVKMGHEVTVVTGTPNYPEGVIYSGYEKGQKKDDICNGVRIHRCFIVGRKGGILKRFLNYYSYVFSSCAYVKTLPGDFDVVLVNQLSPVMMAEAGILYKKRWHKKLILYSLDLWPESLLAGGVKRHSLIYKVFHGISKRIYRSADHILVSSSMFTDYLKKEFGIASEKMTYLPQYAETIFNPQSCAKVPNGYIDLMFAGNIGRMQSVDTILKAAKLTEDIENLRWHIVGDGSDLNHCKQMAEELNLKSVIFYGRQDLSKMPEFYSMADAMLVTLKKDPVLSMTLPGKVQSYMAAGKPIIASADGEIARVIALAKCGFCVPAEDEKVLAEQVKTFIFYSKQNNQSFFAYEFYRNYFCKKRFITHMIEQLEV